jgi:hypothetical protein
VGEEKCLSPKVPVLECVIEVGGSGGENGPPCSNFDNGPEDGEDEEESEPDGCGAWMGRKRMRLGMREESSPEEIDAREEECEENLDGEEAIPREGNEVGDVEDEGHEYREGEAEDEAEYPPFPLAEDSVSPLEETEEQPSRESGEEAADGEPEEHHSVVRKMKMPFANSWVIDPGGEIGFPFSTRRPLVSSVRSGRS